jgi:alkanesulfonate monooxygenase SsuD/methylene tetrahydromethanopterin reductase-like flavin-dependent oxidoreductase (luciferase family)
MKAWQFSENAYPYLPPAESYPSIRVSLPNRHYDPKKGADLYDRFIDEWCIAEDEGMEIMLNEHHQTATCVDPAAPLVLAALGRLTKKARLLILGNPIANRRMPVRVAEEMAMCDMLSRGRIEAGFVRGVPYEISPANSNPVRMNERFWEALDLIVKAWTSHDGPVSHEGRFFHHRAINIWPRCYQDPHPPIWISTTSPSGAYTVGKRGYVQATFLTGFDETRKIYDNYRRGWRDAGRGNDVPIDRLAYAALVYVGKSEAEARAGAEKLLWYVTANKVAPQFANPPGYVPVQANVAILRGAEHPLSAFARNAGIEGAIQSGFMMAGTPDQVYRQFKQHYHRVGGYGHLLIMGQAGFLDHDDTVAGIRNFAREVYPRLKEEFPDTTVSGTASDAPLAFPNDLIPGGNSSVAGSGAGGQVLTPLGAARAG